MNALFYETFRSEIRGVITFYQIFSSLMIFGISVLYLTMIIDLLVVIFVFHACQSKD